MHAHYLRDTRLETASNSVCDGFHYAGKLAVGSARAAAQALP